MTEGAGPSAGKKGGQKGGQKAAAKGGGEKKQREAAPPRETIRGFPRTGVITINKDKEGNPYGAKNNPRRGAAGERFASLKDGMTVEKAVARASEGGYKPGDLRRDAKSGYITITPAKA